nr:LLM class flavin-dependent oxidoreductase [Streptomyces capitiformicae]
MAHISPAALAPGRIICGVGTGNTARRTLGMRPTTAARLENFIAALQDLCAGRSTEYREGDRVRDIRFLHTGAHVNTADPIEFVVAALGPQAAAVAGRRGTGLISFGLLDPTAWHALHDARRHAAQDTPRAPRLPQGLLPGHLAPHTRRGRRPPRRRDPGRDRPPRSVAAGLRRRHGRRKTHIRRATQP